MLHKLPINNAHKVKMTNNIYKSLEISKKTRLYHIWYIRRQGYYKLILIIFDLLLHKLPTNNAHKAKMTKIIYKSFEISKKTRLFHLWNIRWLCAVPLRIMIHAPICLWNKKWRAASRTWIINNRSCSFAKPDPALQNDARNGIDLKPLFIIINQCFSLHRFAIPYSTSQTYRYYFYNQWKNPILSHCSEILKYNTMMESFTQCEKHKNNFWNVLCTDKIRIFYTYSE